MRLVRARNFRNAFPNQRVHNDEFRFAVVILFRVVQRIKKRLHVLPVDFLDIEAVRLEAGARVFALRRSCRRVECDRIGIVDENQIIEPEMSGECAGLRCNAFLHTTVTR